MWDFDSEVDSLDAVPEEFRSLYSQVDDKFKLNAKLSEKLSQGAGAHQTLTTVRKERDDAKKALAKFTVISPTPEELQTRIDELETNADKVTGAEERVAAVKRDLEATYGTEILGLKTTLAAERTENDKDYRDRQIMEAVSSTDAIPKALQPILIQRIETVREDGKRRLVIKDENGEEVFDGHGNPIGVKAYVERLKANEDYGFAFKPTGTAGAGTNPNSSKGGLGGKNPFAKETFNMTEAQKLIVENPVRATALANAANYPVTW